MMEQTTTRTTYLGNGKTDNRPSKQEHTLEEIYTLLSKPRISARKDGKYILAVTLGEEGIRNEKNVQSVNGFFLDFDKGIDEFTIIHKLKGLKFIAHTTYSHTPDKPRWRVFIPYAEDHPKEEHKLVYFNMVERFDGYEIDKRCRTASQLWFLPTAKEKSIFRVFRGEGEFLDPSTLETKSFDREYPCSFDDEAPTESEKPTQGLYVRVGERDQWFFDEAIKGRTEGRLEGETLAGLEYIRVNNTQQPKGNVFTHADLKRKVASAYRSEYEIEGAERGTKEKEAPVTFKAITADKLAKKRFKKIKWVVESLIPEGVSILAARPKAGKTRLALSLAIGVSSGQEVLEKFKVEKCDVLCLLADERSDRLAQRRIKALEMGSPAGLHIVSEDIPKLNDGFEEHFDEWMRVNPGTGLVIVDTWGKIRPAKKAGVDPYEHEGDYLARIQELSREYESCILLIHHTKKGGETGEEGLLGSTAISGGVDTILMLNRTVGVDNCFDLNRTSRYDYDVRFSLENVQRSGNWRYLGESSEYQTTAAKLEIWDAMRQPGGPWGIKQLADLTGKSYAAMAKQLLRMEANGEVRSTIEGKKKLYHHGYVDMWS